MHSNSITSRRTVFLAGTVLVLATFAAYANSLTLPFIFDDLLSIPQNPSIRGWLTSLTPPGGGVTVTGRPLLNLSFAFNYAVSGDQVWSYHAFNLVIHAMAALTLFGLVRRTLGTSEAARFTQGITGKIATWLAFGSALIWALHPLQTESVTYTVQRAESLMGLFYLLTLYCFLRGTEVAAAGPPATATLASRGWFTLSFLSCLAGMATKEVMVSAPVIALLYDRTFLSGSFRAAWRRRRLVYLALGATWILLAGLVLHAAGRGGSAGFSAGIGFWTYVVTQFQALTHYLWLSLWPHPLVIDYGVQWVNSIAEVVPYALFVVALIAAIVVAFYRRPWFGFAGVWWAAILAPTSLVPVVRQTLAEHRTYLALAPAVIAVVLVLYRALGRRAWWALAAIAVPLAGVTLQRNTVYRSDTAIWADTVAKRPGNAAARNNYGNILLRSGKPEQALAQFSVAVKIDPGYADAHYNAGNALTREGRFPEAIARYEAALRINPRLADAEATLGVALEDCGRNEEAVAHYEQALRIDPRHTDAHNDLGLALARQGRFTEAIAHYEEALKINPALPDVDNNLGNALRASGHPEEAIARYQQALRLKPDFAAAHNDLGNAYRELERLPEAITEYEQVLKLDPDVPEAHNNLGIALLMAGRAPDAIAQFETALRLNPKLAQVHLNLAIALESIGKSAEAAAQFEAAKALGATLPEGMN